MSKSRFREKTTNDITFVSLFSGCGGFDLGFVRSGFKLLAAYDINESAIRTHKANVPGQANQTDLSSLSSADLPHCPDLVVAGPPCQGFSLIGKRDVSDPRNNLLLLAATIATWLNPKVVLIENVLGAKLGAHDRHWKKAVMTLRAAGYTTSEHTVNALEFGVPQMRRRLILTAWRGSREMKLSSPNARHQTIKSALEGVTGLPNHIPLQLPKSSLMSRIAPYIKPGQNLSDVRVGPNYVHTWEVPSVFGATTQKERQILEIVQKWRRRNRQRDWGDADPLTLSQISKLFGGDPEVIVESLIRKQYMRKIGRRFDLKNTFNGRFRRLSLDRPSYTVDTKFGQPRLFLHPKEHRGFTAREAARIQGFPDDFVFHGNLTEQFIQIGNSVPPPVAAQVAVRVREFLTSG